MILHVMVVMEPAEGSSNPRVVGMNPNDGLDVLNAGGIIFPMEQELIAAVMELLEEHKHSFAKKNPKRKGD